MSSRASAPISKMLKRERLSALCPIISPTEDNFFYCENNKKQSYIGACFQAETINGIDEQFFKLFVGSISVKLPPDSIIQISHLATNHVGESINTYHQNKIQAIHNNIGLSESQKQSLLDTVQARTSSLNESTRVSPSGNGVTLKDNRLFFSVKVPADLKLSEYDLQRAKEQIMAVHDGLKSTVLNSIRQLSKEEYLAQVRSYIYPYSPYDFVYDEHQKVSEQVFSKTSDIDNSDSNFVKIDETYFGVLSVKALPKRATIALMDSLVGDIRGSNKQVATPFLINCTIIIPDTDAENSSIEFNYLQTQDTATPFALKMSPKLRDRLDGLRVMFEETKSGEIPCKLYFNMVLFNKNRGHLTRVASVLENYYKTEGLSLTLDTKIVLPLFWNTIPLYPSIESLKNTHRTLTMTMNHASVFAPIFSDFQNYKDQFSQVYYTRRGNIYGFDPMRGQNHNGMIFGSSGGGKSVTTNNFVLQEFESGAMIRIIDEGRSYEKICSALGGTYIEFTEESDVCLNPFTLVKDINEDIDQLTSIVELMASPSTPLNDFCSTAIKRAIVSAFTVASTKTTITDVADFLAKQPEPEITRLGRQLYDYTDRGSHARYFNGDNNLNLDSPLIVLELEGLKQNEKLKTVVMMLLLSRIQSDMYFNTQYPRKFVFFEEVTSYLHKKVVAEYIADFYARLRKYNAGVWLITQNIQSVAKSESIGKILNNANYTIYLPYNSDEIDSLVKNGYVENTPFVVDMFKSLKLVKGQYSEALILESDVNNVSVIRIILNRYEQILFSSTGETFRPLLDRVKKGERIKDIINGIIYDEKKAKSGLGSASDPDIDEALEKIKSGNEDVKTILTNLKRKVITSIKSLNNK